VAASLAGGTAVSVPPVGVGATLVGGGAVGVASALGDADGAVVDGVALGLLVALGGCEGDGVRLGRGRTLWEGDGFGEGRAGWLVTGVTSIGLGDDSGRGGRTHR
jgi:hypothetical protein